MTKRSRWESNQVLHTAVVYKSELSDEQWHYLQGILPTQQGRVGRPMRLDLREVINAIFYVVRTGCQWMNLPSNYPHPKSVYYHLS